MVIRTSAYAKAGGLLNLKGTVTHFRLNLTPDRNLDLGTVFLISSFEVRIICYALTLALAIEIVTDIYGGNHSRLHDRCSQNRKCSPSLFTGYFRIILEL